MKSNRRDGSGSGWGLGESGFTLAAIAAAVCLVLGAGRPGVAWKPILQGGWICLVGLFMLGGALLRNESFQSIFAAVDPLRHWFWGGPSDGDRAGSPAVRTLYFLAGTAATIVGCLLAMGKF